MSEDDLVKLLIALASAFVGWLLAQFTSALKSWAHQHKVKKLLLEELRDIEKEVERLQIFLSRQLQIVGAGGIGNTSSAGITNPIYRNYYKDALLSLNQRQRISFQLIGSLVDRVNEGIVELKDLTTELQNEHFNNGRTEKLAKGGVAWGEKVKAEYQHCASLQWQVKYHLENKRGPDLSPFTKPHENFCRYLEQAEQEALRLIQDGSTIDRSRFDQTYDREAFNAFKAAP